MTDLATEPHDPVDDALAAARSAVAAARVAANTAAGNELVAITEEPTEVKERLRVGYVSITKSVAEAERLRKQAKEAIEAKKNALDAELRAMMAELEPLQKQAKRLADGIDAVNLYLGRDEFIEELRGGEPAPADTPLILRQQVLAMDEECALIAEEGGIDYRNIGDFLGWLMASNDNLDQVLPDARGVVAIMPRRTSLDYGNIFENTARNQENHHTWWLLRNGERLYLMTTEFNVGARVTPLADEFTKTFIDPRTNAAYEPGSSAWLKAEEQADAKTRHYLKVGLILQGLIDRTTVFQPLPASKPSWLKQADYDAGLVRIVADDDLTLTDGRPSFQQWQRAARDKMNVGHRVVGHFGWGGQDDYPISPRTASPPSGMGPFTIHRENENNFYFTFDRTDRPWNRKYWDDSPAKTKATYRLYKHEWGTVSYVPIDAVAEEDIAYYLRSRVNRHEYRTLIPALRAALEFKQQERVAEAPFRALIAAELESRGHTGDGDSYAGELIAWWKTANKWHRALNGDPAHEAKAQRAILAEAARRQTATVTAAVLASLRERHPDAAAIAFRSRDVVVVELQERAWSHFPANVYVRIHEYSKTGAFRTVSEWKTLRSASVAKWTLLLESEAWKSIVMDPPGWHITDPQIDDVIQIVKMQAAEPVAAIRLTQSKSGRVDCRLWLGDTRWEGDTLSSGSNYVTVEVHDGIAHAAIESGHHSVLRQNWTLDRDGVPVPPWFQDDYREGAKPRDLVFIDATLDAEERRNAMPWADHRARKSAIDTELTSYLRRLSQSWDAAEEARIRQAFDEDFGDDSLWEGHRKTVRPTRWPIEARSGWRDPVSKALAEAARASLVAGRPLAGRTVGELLAGAGAGVGKLTAAMLAITFTDAPAEEATA